MYSQRPWIEGSGEEARAGGGIVKSISSRGPCLFHRLQNPQHLAHGSVNIFCKGPVSEYLRLWGGHTSSVTST